MRRANIDRGLRPARAWRLAALLGVFTAGTTLNGCGVGPQAAPEKIDPKSVPYGLLAASGKVTTTVPGSAGAEAIIYLEGKQRLVPVERPVPEPVTIGSALRQLVSGPTATQSSLGLTSPASAVGPFHAGPVRNGVVSVDLPLSFENLGGQDQIVAAAQIVFTATASGLAKGVLFLVDGQAAQVPGDRGNLIQSPVTRAAYSLLAPS